MFKRLLELLKLNKQRQPILQQCSVSRRSYSEKEVADIVDYCIQHIDIDLLNSKQEFHRKVAIKHHVREWSSRNGG